MKCLVLGHTRGIGKSIYETLLKNNHFVDGISRSTGYDFENDYNKIVDKALTYELVINNPYANDCQYRLLEDLNNKVPNIITIGSIAGFYPDIFSKKHNYSTNKNNLIELNKRLSYTSTSNLLLLNIGLTENASPEPGCSYNDIASTCLFWLSTPSINQIDFRIKLSEINVKLIEADFGISLQDYSSKFF
jgi:hypothetical protein